MFPFEIDRGFDSESKHLFSNQLCFFLVFRRILLLHLQIFGDNSVCYNVQEILINGFI